MTRETPEERSERILAELREATREAAGVLKDLQAAAKEARAQADDYLGKGVQDALNFYKAQVEEVCQHYADEARKDIAGHLTQWAAVIKNEISRERLINTAATRIIAEMERQKDEEIAAARSAPGEIVIQLCDRPHAD